MTLTSWLVTKRISPWVCRRCVWEWQEQSIVEAVAETADHLSRAVPYWYFLLPQRYSFLRHSFLQYFYCPFQKYLRKMIGAWPVPSVDELEVHPRVVDG